jgi:hypothetical protein
MDAAGPSTHLTFLFTDIEASSRAWEAQSAVMSLALARHDELLHMAVKSTGGTIFKHTGDGVCAAFPTAAAAVAAAHTAQLALQAEDWSDTAPLRVRMALHAPCRGASTPGGASPETSRPRCSRQSAPSSPWTTFRNWRRRSSRVRSEVGWPST